MALRQEEVLKELQDIETRYQQIQQQVPQLQQEALNLQLRANRLQGMLDVYEAQEERDRTVDDV